tara:strand:+ start:39 stop:335 length:297 start_codon:yes stop_codon:yes gene_type:complete
MTDQEKQQINRIVNGNMMVAQIKVLQENLEYFRGEYKGEAKNVFKRILTNCEILFDTSKMTDEEKQEIETVSDALIDGEYQIREQYRQHVTKQLIKDE